MNDLIPPKIVHFVNNSEHLKWDIIVRENHARLSFSSIEKLILRNLQPALKDAYSLAKCLVGCVPEMNRVSPFLQYITSYILKNGLFLELDPILSYSLIDNRICKFSTQHGIQMAQQDTDKRNWTSKILKRLIKIFDQEDSVNIYCFPAMSVPLIFMAGNDDFGCNQYVRVLNQCLKLLKEQVDETNK